MGSRRDVTEIVDLTRDESTTNWFRPRSNPQPKTRVIIQISDSEDEATVSPINRVSNQTKLADRKRDHVQDPASNLNARTTQHTSTLTVDGSASLRQPIATCLTNKTGRTAFQRPGYTPTENRSPAGSISTSSKQQAASIPSVAQTARLQQARKPCRTNCAECKEAGLECDEERPCSRCVEPGLDCRYPGDPVPKPKSPKVTTKVNAAGVFSQPARISKSPQPKSPENSSSSSLSSSESRVASRGRPKSVETGKSDEKARPKPVEVEEDYPANVWRPESYNELQDLLKVCNDNMNTQREYWLRCELLRSVDRLRQDHKRPTMSNKTNPFLKLVANAADKSDSTDGYHELKFSKGSKKLVTSHFSCTELGHDPRQPIVPAYKSIGRMGTSFVAKNVHTLKHLPYFPDEEDQEIRVEREQDLHSKYRSGGHYSVEEVNNELVSQRKCLELLHRWYTCFSDLTDTLSLTSEHIVTWAHGRTFPECEICGLAFGKQGPSAPHASNPAKVNELCDWLYKAFLLKAKVPMWHFVESKYTGKLESKNDVSQVQQMNHLKPSLCVICCVPNCAMHGQYIDGDDEANSRRPLINDPEIENNKRELFLPESRANTPGHICGLYCAFGDKDVTQYAHLWGLDESGIFSGHHNKDFNPVSEHAGFSGSQPCSRGCFISRKSRQGWEPISVKTARSYIDKNLNAKQNSFLEMRARLFGSSTRLPCSVAKRLKIDCSLAFRCLVNLHISTASVRGHEKVAPVNQGPKNRYQVKPPKYGDHSLKQPHQPCSHAGPCRKDYGCVCAKIEGHCEYSCACDASCHRRFSGCNCEGPCYENMKCPCWKSGRECDPWLCKSCGVEEVLDPSNKYNDEIRQGRCVNNRTQLGLPARTFKGASQIQGWGLFAGEDLPRHSYIGEYKGEIITSESKEAGRRGLTYFHGALEYLFSLNDEQELDGSRYGNKMRFINHTRNHKFVNLRSLRQTVSGVTHVSFWTKRDIKAGEEFYYDYGYLESQTQNFNDPGSIQPIEHPLLPIPKPRINESGPRHANEVSEDESENQSNDDSADALRNPVAIEVSASSPGKQTKRKRRTDDEEPPILNPFSQVVNEPQRRPVVKPKPKLIVKPVSQSREFPHARLKRSVSSLRKEIKQDTDEEDEDYDDEPDGAFTASPSNTEPSESDDEVLAAPKFKKKGAPFVADKRKGGEAQRKAAITRAKNRQKG